jgi:hypothetical protein
MVSEGMVSIGWPDPFKNSIFGGAAALGQRIDFHLFHERHRRLGLSVFLETANEKEHVIIRGLADEVALWHLACVARRQEEVLATMPFSGPSGSMSAK